MTAAEEWVECDNYSDCKLPHKSGGSLGVWLHDAYARPSTPPRTITANDIVTVAVDELAPGDQVRLIEASMSLHGGFRQECFVERIERLDFGRRILYVSYERDGEHRRPDDDPTTVFRDTLGVYLWKFSRVEVVALAPRPEPPVQPVEED